MMERQPREPTEHLETCEEVLEEILSNLLGMPEEIKSHYRGRLIEARMWEDAELLETLGGGQSFEEFLEQQEDTPYPASWRSIVGFVIGMAAFPTIVPSFYLAYQFEPWGLFAFLVPGLLFLLGLQIAGKEDI